LPFETPSATVVPGASMVEAATPALMPKLRGEV
jgi:hypothetical protein